jgi:hypothetical protein
MVIPVQLFAIAAISAAVTPNTPPAPAIPMVVPRIAGWITIVLFVFTELAPPESVSVFPVNVIAPNGVPAVPIVDAAEIPPTPVAVVSVHPATLPFTAEENVIRLPAVVRTVFAPMVATPV